MSVKPPPATKDERLAKALRENLARRKALMRTKRDRADADGAATAPKPAERAGRGEASS